MKRSILMSTLASLFTLHPYKDTDPHKKVYTQGKNKSVYSANGKAFTRGKRSKSLKSRANRRKAK